MSWQNEIAEIADENNGILRAIDVVRKAKNPKTELHSQFEWDNDKAGHQWRLFQARQLIVRVYITTPEREEPIQAFVSLISDRQNSDGGYRSIVSVMSDSQQRAQIINQILQQIGYWQEKYREIMELRPIFKAAETIKRRQKVGANK